jgi:hypothetical protein
MDWFLKGMKMLFYKEKDLDSVTSLKDEVSLRKQEQKEILLLERETDIELKDIEKSIQEIDSGLDLVRKKEATIDQMKDFSDKELINTIHSINRILLIRFHDVRRLILLDQKHDAVEKSELKGLEEENVREMQDEKIEARVSEEEDDDEEGSIAQERMSIDEYELNQEKRLDADIQMDNDLIRQIQNHTLFTEYPKILTRQNRLLKTAKFGEISSDIRQELEFFKLMEKLEKMRVVILQQEEGHEQEIDLDETAARELDRRDITRKAQKLSNSSRISKRKFLE